MNLLAGHKNSAPRWHRVCKVAAPWYRSSAVSRWVVLFGASVRAYEREAQV